VRGLITYATNNIKNRRDRGWVKTANLGKHLSESDSVAYYCRVCDIIYRLLRAIEECPLIFTSLSTKNLPNILAFSLQSGSKHLQTLQFNISLVILQSSRGANAAVVKRAVF